MKRVPTEEISLIVDFAGHNAFDATLWLLGSYYCFSSEGEPYRIPGWLFVVAMTNSLAGHGGQDGGTSNGLAILSNLHSFAPAVKNRYDQGHAP